MRIEIEDEHPLADRGQGGSKVDGGGGFPDAAFLVRHGENARTRRAVGLANEGLDLLGHRISALADRRIAAFGLTTL